jgi:hypothetical protein
METTTLEQFLKEIKVQREKYEKETKEARESPEELPIEEQFVVASKEMLIDLIKAIEKTYKEQFEEIKVEDELVKLLRKILG